MRHPFRFYYDKSLEYLIQEELKYAHPYFATRYAKERQRMYASLFCRDMRKNLITHDSTCENCGFGGKLHIDHIIPISKGGTNTPDNVQVLCAGCNLKKGAQIW